MDTSAASAQRIYDKLMPQESVILDRPYERSMKPMNPLGIIIDCDPERSSVETSSRCRNANLSHSNLLRGQASSDILALLQDRLWLRPR